MEYQPVIGLEVHVQMKTETKMFCGCSTRFGAEPNKNTCPICLGMPGTLPVVNSKAIGLAAKTALALNSRIERINRFARKNYFYPDLPKGYQISQYDQPLSLGGYVDIKVNGDTKRIKLTRIHLEEDAGKLVHGEWDRDSSYVDLNRAGVPLMEIVSEPDISSPDEAKEYMIRLKEILEYIEVSDCNMEEGSLRCDANISVRPVGSSKLGIRAEIKNMNSFRFLHKALEYEIERQIDILREGGKIIQETRLFDSSKGITLSMRIKEEAHDYRYFPDPDLLPIEIMDQWIGEIRETVPELPDSKRSRFRTKYELPEYDAAILTSDRILADYFEETVAKYNQPKIVSNWLMGEILRFLNDKEMKISEFLITPEKLAGLLQLIDKGTISGKIAKTVFEEMAKSGKKADDVVKEKGLIQITNKDDILRIVDEVVSSHPDEVAGYKNGKSKLFGFFVGQVMKASKGKASPAVVNELLKERLS